MENSVNDLKGSDIRVRFAPSPTGHLHLGGARTALYNWLLARSSGGAFVLRIEDTDTERSNDAAIDQIITSLSWLGLDWDEGPGVGGAHGPYRQMERRQLYADAAERLLAEKRAYRCYCTPEELDGERREARKREVPYVYSGRCRNLEASVDAGNGGGGRGRESVIRLKTPSEGHTLVHDLVRGEVSFENALCGDFILVRSNGVPTYNFAVAIDDTAMEITHVIRGDDHLPNTPKQIMVAEALGKKPPLYGHLPLILGPDRAPLSKRHGAVSIEEFRSRGFLREALCNYLALLGWSFDAESTLFSMDELVEKFSIERVGSTAAAFDMDKLLWMNGHYIRELEPVELAERLEAYLPGTKLAGLPGRDGNPDIDDLVPLVQEKMKTLEDFVELTDFFFLPLEFEKKALRKLTGNDRAAELLDAAAEALQQVEPFDIENIEAALRRKADEIDVKLGKFLQPLRIAVSGKTVTPGMFETLSVLGRDKSLDRITNALTLRDVGSQSSITQDQEDAG